MLSTQPQIRRNSFNSDVYIVSNPDTFVPPITNNNYKVISTESLNSITLLVAQRIFVEDPINVLEYLSLTATKEIQLNANITSQNSFKISAGESLSIAHNICIEKSLTLKVAGSVSQIGKLYIGETATITTTVDDASIELNNPENTFDSYVSIYTQTSGNNQGHASLACASDIEIAGATVAGDLSVDCAQKATIGYSSISGNLNVTASEIQENQVIVSGEKNFIKK